jgi:hypothetical protein
MRRMAGDNDKTVHDRDQPGPKGLAGTNSTDPRVQLVEYDESCMGVFPHYMVALRVEVAQCCVVVDCQIVGGRRNGGWDVGGAEGMRIRVLERRAM